jgi:hypothetical protein
MLCFEILRVLLLAKASTKMSSWAREEANYEAEEPKKNIGLRYETMGERKHQVSDTFCNWDWFWIAFAKRGVFYTTRGPGPKSSKMAELC